MSFAYGERSKQVYMELVSPLQVVFFRVLHKHDHALEHGLREPHVQQQKFLSGRSQVPGFKVDGSINEYDHRPRENFSWAVDVWPYLNGKRLTVPSYREVARSNDAAWVQDAISRYCQFTYFAGIVLAEAEQYFTELEAISGEIWEMTWGGNWDNDTEILTDQNFDDYPHFIVEKL